MNRVISRKKIKVIEFSKKAVVIRADASIQSGIGHVIRCMALAQELQRKGYKVCFIVSECPDTLLKKLEVERFTVSKIFSKSGSANDVEETVNLAKNENALWVIADGYVFTEIFQKEKGTDTISKFSLNISRDTRDSLFDPKNGYLLSAMTELNSKIFGASVNSYRLELQGSNYISFIENMFTLHTGLKIGQVDRFGSGGKLAPIYERYFLGGGDTVRGFPYREISPIDHNKDPYGGESMIVGNVELTHPIYDFIRGAIFVDAGGVWKRAWDMKLDEINVGAGYGLRIKLPYFNAPVKLDLAYPIVKSSKLKNIDRKLRFHFNLGLTWSP